MKEHQVHFNVLHETWAKLCFGLFGPLTVSNLFSRFDLHHISNDVLCLITLPGGNNGNYIFNLF